MGSQQVDSASYRRRQIGVLGRPRTGISVTLSEYSGELEVSGQRQIEYALGGWQVLVSRVKPISAISACRLPRSRVVSEWLRNLVEVLRLSLGDSRARLRPMIGGAGACAAPALGVVSPALHRR